MAEGLRLEDALRRFGLLLIDTSVLIQEFKQSTGRLRDVNRPQRATSIVAVWEFFHGPKGALLPRGERAARRSWLDDQGITALRLHQNCSKSFESLLKTDGPPSVADSLLAAECLARRVPVVTLNVGTSPLCPGFVMWRGSVRARRVAVGRPP